MEKKQNPKVSGTKETKNQQKKEKKIIDKNAKATVSKPKPYIRPGTPYTLLIEGPPPTSRLRVPLHQKERELVEKMATTPPELLFDFLYGLFNEKGRKYLATTYPDFYKQYLARNQKTVIQAEFSDPPYNNGLPWNNPLPPNDPYNAGNRFGDKAMDFFYKVFGSGYTPAFESANTARWKNFEHADRMFEELRQKGIPYEIAMKQAFSAYSAGESSIKSNHVLGGYESQTKAVKDMLTKIGGGFAPAAFGGHSSPHHMSIEQRDNIVHVSGNIPLANVQNNATGFVNWFTLAGSTTVLDQANHCIDVSVDSLGNRLALLGSLYALVKYKKMKLIYTPSVATTTGGLNIAFAFNPDPSRPDVTGGGFDYAELLQYQHCCTTAAWQPCELEIPVSSDWLFTSIRDTANIAQERQVTCGLLVVNSSTNPATGAIYGTCRLEYEVEFTQPTYTYGLTLYKQLETKYSADAVNFIMEHLVTEPTVFLSLLKTYGYSPPEKLDDGVTQTLAALGIAVPRDPRAASFSTVWDSFCKSLQKS